MKKPLTRETELETLLVISAGLTFLYFISGQQHVWLLIASLALGITGIFSPFLGGKIAWLWMQLGTLLGAVMPKIVLSLIFFLLLFPIAALSKLLSPRKNLLQLRKGKEDSYYTVREHRYEAKDLENTW